MNLRCILTFYKFYYVFEISLNHFIGQDYDSVVERKIKDKKKGLVNEGENFKFYVKKWSEVVGEAENRMRFLLERLKIERDNIVTPDSMEDIMTDVVTTNNLD